ncbi:hypothetical protein MCAMS1_02239 [biofilm metagenome]
MIGLDTNVLVRLLTADDAAQLKTATQLIAGFAGQPGSFFINELVLVELIWVLQRLYGYSQPESLQAVQALLASDAFVFEDRTRLNQAVRLCNEKASGFADAMIALKNAVTACEYTATFDKDMVGLPKISLLTAC